MTDASNGWFLTHGGDEVHGPFTLAALIDAAKQGNVIPATMVRHEEHTKGTWLPAGRIRPIAEALNTENTKNAGAQNPAAQGGQPPNQQSSQPTKTAAQQPAPQQPAQAPPAQQAPVQQAPVQQAPAQTQAPAPQPAPFTPAPAQPTYTQPAPTQSVPEQPAPIQSVQPQAFAGPTAPSTVIETQPVGRRGDILTVPTTFGAAVVGFFDFRFRYFVTPWIVKITWGICVVLAVIAMCIFTVNYLLRPLVSSAESTSGQSMSFEGDGTMPESVRIETRSSGQFEFQPPTLVEQNMQRFIVYGATMTFVFFLLLSLRMSLELAIVLFRIAGDLGTLKEFFKEQEKMHQPAT